MVSPGLWIGCLALVVLNGPAHAGAPGPGDMAQPGATSSGVTSGGAAPPTGLPQGGAQAAPPNPPPWLKLPISSGAVFSGARGWVAVDSGAIAAATAKRVPDIVLVTGDWAGLSAQTLHPLQAPPGGKRRLVIAAAGSGNVDRAMAAMRAGFDGVAVSGNIAGLVTELRKRNPDFVILLDTGADIPGTDAPLSAVDGLIVHNVLRDRSGGAYPQGTAAARRAGLEALLKRSVTVLVAEHAADAGTARELKRQLQAMGAIPFVKK
jgi:hypothetical protein